MDVHFTSAIHWLAAGSIWAGVFHVQEPPSGPFPSQPNLPVATLSAPAKPRLSLTVPGLPRAPKIQKSYLANPPPGTYVTEPFKCIVIVPGGNIDPAMVVPAPDHGYILEGKPALRFVPRQSPARPGNR